MLRLLVPKYICLLVAVAWTFVIAFLCLTSFTNLPSIGIGGADKYLHFTMHFVFTALWYLYFRMGSLNRKQTLAKVALSSFCYGIAIEIAQELFTATRHADIFDVLANSSGAIAAWCVIILYQSILKKH